MLLNLSVILRIALYVIQSGKKSLKVSGAIIRNTANLRNML